MEAMTKQRIGSCGKSMKVDSDRGEHETLILKSNVRRTAWMQLKNLDYDSHLQVLAGISQRMW